MTLYKTAQYVAKFRCDGNACGARCCHGWSVELTQEDKARLEQHISPKLVQLRKKLSSVKVLQTKVPGHLHTHRMEFDEQGKCSFLTDSHTCEIHATLGDSAIADLCSQYPKEVGRVGSDYEVWATLACPIAAKLCLLDEQGADQIDTTDPYGIRMVNREFNVGANTLDYFAYLDEVRQFVVKVLSNRQFPLRDRLFFISYFGHRTAPYFRSDVLGIDRRQLQLDMALLGDEAFQKGLSAEIDTNSVPGNYAISLIYSIIEQNPTPHAPALSTNLSIDLASASALRVRELETISSDEWLQAWMEYSIKRLRWEKPFGALIEQALENYSKVFWLKDWYVTSPNLLVHAVACVLRVSMVRFQLFTHPRLTQMDEAASLDERRLALEQTLLDVVTETTRVIDHDQAFRTSLHRALAKRGMEDLPHAGILLML